MSELRRRLLMQAKQADPIIWDYEWYPPEEMPEWLSVGKYATGEMGADYFRIYAPSSPGNYVNKNFFEFSSNIFPANQSYLIEMDIKEMAVRVGNSVQSSIMFFSTDNGVPRITRYTTGSISGSSLWKLGLNTANTQSGSLHITDNLRFKLRVLCDIVTPKFTLSVNNISLSSVNSLVPRIIYSRYVHSKGGYWDIYSVKIKVLNNE